MTLSTFKSMKMTCLLQQQQKKSKKYNKNNKQEEEEEECCCVDNDNDETFSTYISSLSVSLRSTTTTSSSSLEKETNSKKKVVSFDSIEIREYPIILGDNPSTHDGIPITIGWKPQSRECFKIDDYEERQKQFQLLQLQRRRRGDELILSTKYKFQLVVLGGATGTKIGETSLTVSKIQKHRAQSSQKSPLELLKEGFHRTLHPNRKTSSSSSSSSFSRVPNDAPHVLSTWKANGEKLTFLTKNAPAAH